MTNANNFMDGIDGIAGITAESASFILTCATGAAGCGSAALVPLALAAGALGFLACNWPPARVFMGDVGNTFSGFTIAAVPLLLPTADRPTLLPVAILAMWPFLFDAAFTLVKRVIRQENILKQHRGHLYQHVVIVGRSHRSVASLYGCLSAVCGTVAAGGPAFPPLRPIADNLAASVIVLVPVFVVKLSQACVARVACRVSP